MTEEERKVEERRKNEVLRALYARADTCVELEDPVFDRPLRAEEDDLESLGTSLSSLSSDCIQQGLETVQGANAKAENNPRAQHHPTMQQGQLPHEDLLQQDHEIFRRRTEAVVRRIKPSAPRDFAQLSPHEGKHAVDYVKMATKFLPLATAVSLFWVFSSLYQTVRAESFEGIMDRTLSSVQCSHASNYIVEPTAYPLLPNRCPTLGIMSSPFTHLTLVTIYPHIFVFILLLTATVLCFFEGAIYTLGYYIVPLAFNIALAIGSFLFDKVRSSGVLISLKRAVQTACYGATELCHQFCRVIKSLIGFVWHSAGSPALCYYFEVWWHSPFGHMVGRKMNSVQFWTRLVVALLVLNWGLTVYLNQDTLPAFKVHLLAQERKNVMMSVA
jgi:hypothetical protein